DARFPRHAAHRSALLPLRRTLRAARAGLPGGAGRGVFHGHRALAASQLERGRRVGQAGVGPEPLPDDHEQDQQHRHLPAHAARIAPGRGPLGGRDHGQAPPDRPGREHAGAVHGRQRLRVGRALPPPQALPVRGVHAGAAHRPLPAPRPQARIDTRIGLNIDFAFTLAELAGVVPPVEEDGRSLVRLLDDTDPAWRTDHLYEQWLDPDDEDSDVVPPTLAQVRGTQWKYTEYA